MLAQRIIACLDVADGRVVKGIGFRDHRVVGDIVELAPRYADEGVDELVFYDIAASPERRRVDVAWVARVAQELDIPFCVAGGIRSAADAEAVLAAGADKISVNSPALDEPDLIDALAARFGSQCVVIGIDCRRADDAMHAEVWRDTGAPDRARASGRELLDWVREVGARGAGEIVLNCMRADGARSGYDLATTRAVRAATTLPLVASGGAGTAEHFADVLLDARADAALAASVFHSGEIRIAELKCYLMQRGCRMRPVSTDMATGSPCDLAERQFPLVIPAKAGIPRLLPGKAELDSGFRRNDGLGPAISSCSMNATDIRADGELAASLDWDKAGGLVPLIVQHHHDGRVLMLGYTDRDALERTLATGDVHFFSRSRDALWRKGETSGNRLRVVTLTADCDRDALLCQALPTGPTCHRGTASCFDDAVPAHAWLNTLESVIAERRRHGLDSSYVARLFAAGTARVAQKVGEEGVETALAAVGGDRDALRDEAADLLFHLLVLLQSADLRLADVVAELSRRHAAPGP
jgi:cyclase